MEDIVVTWEGEGDYIFTDPEGEDTILLGLCDSEDDLAGAVDDAVHAGNGEADWDGWHTVIVASNEKSSRVNY